MTKLRPRSIPRYASLEQRLGVDLVPPPWAPVESHRAPTDDPRLPRYKPNRLVFGTRRVWPDTAAQPRHDNDSTGTETVTVVRAFGRGPIQLTDLRLGEQLIVPGRLPSGRNLVKGAAIGDFTYELLEGRAGDPGLTLYPQVIATTGLNVNLPKSDDREFRYLSASSTTPAATTEIDVTVRFPVGLSKKVKANGTTTYKGIGCKLRFAARGIGTGAKLGDDGVKDLPVRLDGVGNADAFEKTFTLELGTDKTTTGYKKGWEVAGCVYWVSDQAVAVAPVWIKLRARGPKLAPGLAGQCVLAVRAPLAGVSADEFMADLNALTLPELKRWSGGAWAVGTTRSPAAAFRDVLQGAETLTPIADARIDLAALQAWAADCDAAKLYFDYDFGGDRGNGTTDSALRTIAASGLAAYAVRDGVYTVIREPNPATAVVAGHFCPRNAHGFRTVPLRVDLPHAIRATFDNAARKGIRDTQIVYAEGYNLDGSSGKIAATRFESWDIEGVVELQGIEQIVAQRLAVGAARTEHVELEADWEVMRSTRGDVVRVAWADIGWGQDQGRVLGIPSATRLRLDTPVTMAPATTYQVRCRRADLSEALLDVVAVVGTRDEFETTGAHGAAVGDLVFFGPTGNTDRACVVVGIAPGEDFGARVTVASLGSTVYGATPSAPSTAAAPATVPQAEVLEKVGIAYVSGAGTLAVGIA